MPYEIKLETFEGPLDLLLHLIHKNEMDIFDIPIATITDQYLEHLDIMKSLNMDIAGDFLLMASILIHIKSKMLLPGTMDEEEGEDPRLEITRPILEYMRLKEIADDLSERDVLGRDVFARSVPKYFQEQINEADAQLDVNIFQLVDAFKRIVDQAQPGFQMRLQKEKWSIKDKTEILMAFLKERKSAFFKDLFSNNESLSEFIVTFLALLEMIHMGLVKVFQPTHESEIRITLSVGGDAENVEG